MTSCRSNDFHYYKVEGVNHYMSKYTSGTAIKVEDCGRKCTSDCKCSGYFYHQETSKCWIAYDLKTLSKSPNSTHVGHIKVPNQQAIVMKYRDFFFFLNLLQLALVILCCFLKNVIDIAICNIVMSMCTSRIFTIVRQHIVTLFLLNKFYL